MRFALACVWLSILAKLVHNKNNCVHFPGKLNEKNYESRHIVCNASYYDHLGHSECDYFSVKVLKIQFCPTETIESHFIGSNVRTLDISSSDYTTLSYLHLNFEHLKRFNVSHNKLTEIHDYLFNSTKKLAEVDFSHNQITILHKLTFFKVPKLTTINISHNQIREINSRLLTILSDLEFLDLSNNKIRWIINDTFKRNFQLKIVNLKNNPVQLLDCDITHLLNRMTLINVSFNDVTSFDLSCANDMEWTANEEEIIFMNSKTEIDLRYPRMNFRSLEKLSISGNRLHNPLAIVKMLGESIENLDLSGNHLGELNKTAFCGLNKLNWLNLRETNLSFDASNPFEHLNNLTHLDISFNNLLTLNISLFTKTLNHLERFEAAGNQFDNGLEIIHCLGSNLLELQFSRNFNGRLNRRTFEHLNDLETLNLSDTHLQHFDVILHKVDELDISRNNLKRLNVTLLSDTLNGLWRFYAAENEFENTAEIIAHLGSNLHELDLSGSYVGTLNETTFEHFHFLESLRLQCTDLLISDVKPFETVRNQLESLDISNNNLTKFDFSTLSIFSLKEINLSENHLTRLDGLTKHSYPQLAKLDITNNKWNCSYLSMLRREWKELEIFEDTCDHFESDTEIKSRINTGVWNTPGNDTTERIATITTVQTESDKEAQTIIAPEMSVQGSSVGSVVLYAVPIGVTAIIIINIVAVVLFFRRKSSLRNRGRMEVSYCRNSNAEEMQPDQQTQAEEEPKPEDHIYEEIEERERPYDRLRFQFDPMPIATENQHYHNFTLANRSTQP